MFKTGLSKKMAIGKGTVFDRCKFGEQMPEQKQFWSASNYPAIIR
jgi:hypothetical protein